MKINLIIVILLLLSFHSLNTVQSFEQHEIFKDGEITLIFNELNTTQNIDEVLITYDPGYDNHKILVEVINSQSSDSFINYTLTSYDSLETINLKYNEETITNETVSDNINIQNNQIDINGILDPGMIDNFSIVVVKACGIDCGESAYLTFQPTGNNTVYLTIKATIIEQGTRQSVDANSILILFIALPILSLLKRKIKY
jgi:hypothetical protein